MPTYQPVAPHIIENMLLDACPERETEMRQGWETFKPEFYLREDDAEEAAISANGNRVSWMHKTFAIDWVIATLGMQALAAYSPTSSSPGPFPCTTSPTMQALLRSSRRWTRQSTSRD